MDLECEGWKKMVKIFPDLGFTEELTEKPELSTYLRNSINKHSIELENPLDHAQCPKLDSDFSKYIILNGLPKCDKVKVVKLTALIVKIFGKLKFPIDESQIEMGWDEEDVKTTGQAFVILKNEADAKISAFNLNGYELDKKHTISACTFPDYEKLSKEFDTVTEQSNKQTDYLELNAQVLEAKKNQYAFQIQKNVTVKSLYGQTKILHNLDPSERQADFEDFVSDKPFIWSPRGTYLILIKSDRVEFLGGKAMEPILSIPEAKVDSVSFSPCERYIMIYTPMKDRPYQIWDFSQQVMKRDFEQERGEDGSTFKWSYDGNYIAKVTKKPITDEKEESKTEEEPKMRTYISIYGLEDCKLIKDSQGDRTSIYVEGLDDFSWAPHKNALVHTSFPSGDNALPRITIQSVPSRQVLNVHTLKDSNEMVIYWHPQGNYLAVMSQTTVKKQSKHTVELFETKEMIANLIPHQQITLNRDIIDFYGVVFEPNQAKFGIHTNSKRILDAGQVNYSNETSKKLVDIFQIKSDSINGFHLKFVGTLLSEKVLEVYFSGAGNVLCTIDQDAPTKTSISFFLIQKNQNEGQAQGNNSTKLTEVEDTYEFRKLARHEIKDRKWDAKWDQHGRYFVIYGRKTNNFDTKLKNLKFFNMFGEVIDFIDDIKDLTCLSFRPRPSDILKPEKIKQLKKDYKKKYEKVQKEEEATEKKIQGDIVREKRRVIREDFLNNFFIPLRREYEKDIPKYEALFPIKKDDLVERDYHNIWAFGEVKSTRTLENI